MIKIKVSGIAVAENCDKNTIEIAKKALTIPNPAYFKIARITGSRFAAQANFVYYKVPKGQEGTILFPRGFVGRFTDYLKRKGIEYELVEDFVDVRKDDLFSTWKEVSLRDYQIPIVEEVLKHKIGVLSAGTGTGKCLKKGTKVLMYNGSIKKIEDIKIGDKVMGDDSSVRNVINKHNGFGDLYKIIPVKGDPFIVKYDHILSLVHTVTGEIINISLDDYLKKTKKFKHLYKLYRVPIKFKRKKIKIDPYFLGIWLADGTSRTQEITNPDKEVISFLKRHARENNYNFKLKNPNDLRCPTWSTPRKNRKMVSMLEKLRNYNLIQNKHIPFEYKTNSRKVRLELLAGLLDGDGHLSGTFDYITKSKQLADDIVYLCRSLGLAAYLKKTIKGIKKLNFYGTYYRISISGNLEIIPNKIKRKQANKRRQKKNVLRTGFTVRKVNSGEYYGIQVDGNSLYCLADFTVTHNTTMSCEMVRRLGYKTTIIVPNTIIQEQFIKEFKKWFDYDVGIVNGKEKNIKSVTVTTWQSLNNDELIKKLSDNTGCLIVDECHGIASKGREKIVKKFRPRCLYGLSGSPRRSSDDGKTEVIFFYLGPIIHRYETTKLKPKVEVIRTGAKIPVLANYHEMIDMMTESGDRNTLLMGLAMGEALEGHKVLVLLKRRDHCQRIMEKLSGFNVYYADSDDKDRNKILGEMRNGDYDFNILIGTVSLLATGTDIPSLDTVIFGGDMKSDVLVEQGAGRILRLFEGKKSAKIIDLFDDKNGIFKNQFFKRRKFYLDKGWEVSF